MKKIIIFLLSLLFIVQSVHAEIPMIDRGDGYAVYPNSSNDTSVEKIKEVPRDLYNFWGLNENISPEEGQPDPSQSPSNLPESPVPSPVPTAAQANPTLPPAQTTAGCPDANTRIHIAGTRYRHLNRYLPCDRPRMIVIHWSAGWSSAQATFDVLNNRDRSCQFAVDDHEVIQMLNLYPNAVERGWCAGGDANTGSINFEITGAWFDEVLLQSGSEKNRQLMIMTDKTVDIACRMIRMYSIPKTAIYGHYQLQSGKSDPGVSYLQFFKQKVNEQC